MSGDDGEEADPFADSNGIEDEGDLFSDLDIGDGADGNDAPEDALFTEVETTELDDGDVWAELEESATGGAAEPEPGPALDAGSDAREGADAATSGETVVRKRAYCEQCEYFSEPPEVSCTYPDGEIVELVDTERFKVRNCPIVARRENSDISAIAGRNEPELEPGDPTAAAESGEGDD